MSRKNDRAAGESAPLDVEALAREANKLFERPTNTVRRRETEDERDERIRQSVDRRRRRTERRVDDRVREAIGDGKSCCITGCGERVPWHIFSGRRDVDVELPLCARHLVVIQHQATPTWDNPDIVAMREQYARRIVEREVARDKVYRIADENGGHEQGQIYFVRINGMVKVGWSSRLRSRLKSYGASAEILCHYPATRQDETLLHRQLRPYRAKGREWYEDCKLIADVIADSIVRHGKPTIFPDWTEPRPDTICSRSA
jgi:hypothetical protein